MAHKELPSEHEFVARQAEFEQAIRRWQNVEVSYNNRTFYPCYITGPSGIRLGGVLTDGALSTGYFGINQLLLIPITTGGDVSSLPSSIERIAKYNSRMIITKDEEDTMGALRRILALPQDRYIADGGLGRSWHIEPYDPDNARSFPGITQAMGISRLTATEYIDADYKNPVLRAFSTVYLSLCLENRFGLQITPSPHEFPELLKS